MTRLSICDFRLAIVSAAIVLMLSVAEAAAPDGYQLTPAAVRHAAAQVEPYLVTIDTVGGVSLGLRDRQQDAGAAGLANPGEGSTTGLVVSPDGLIVTSTFNFIRGPRIITVTLPDGSQHVAELLGRDETRKICLLKIDGVSDLPTIDFASTDRLRVGQWAISVGVGYSGDAPAVSLGIVSALNRAGGRATQTDANISPANYGGPLVDIEGNVIGICTPLNPRVPGEGAGSEWYDSGIGFAVSLHGLDHVVQRMAAGETLQRGLLGVVPSPEADERGVKLMQVAPGSPAADAGLQVGDIVTTVNDRPVTDPTTMRLELSRFLAGDTVEVTWQRGDETMRAPITLATGPFEAEADADASTEVETEVEVEAGNEGPGSR